MSGCRVTIWDGIEKVGRFRISSHRCDLPVVAHRLCEKHYADRLRLGGAR